MGGLNIAPIPLAGLIQPKAALKGVYLESE